jgi:hypothetical protein
MIASIHRKSPSLPPSLALASQFREPPVIDIEAACFTPLANDLKAICDQVGLA